MNAREKIQRGYRVRIYPTEREIYHLSYFPRGLMQSRGLNGRPKAVPEFPATAQLRGDEIQVEWEKTPSDMEATPQEFDDDVRVRVRTLRRWLGQLNALVSNVREWAEEDGWSARIVDKPLEEADIGDYSAPALVLQRDMKRLGLEPVGDAAPGIEGMVDLYVLPAYDDIAKLFFCDGRWRLHSMMDGTKSGLNKPLTKKVFREVVVQMTANEEAKQA